MASSVVAGVLESLPSVIRKAPARLVVFEVKGDHREEVQYWRWRDCDSNWPGFVGEDAARRATGPGARVMPLEDMLRFLRAAHAVWADQ